MYAVLHFIDEYREYVIKEIKIFLHIMTIYLENKIKMF